MSLVELLVAMGIFVVVIAVFMSGVVSMTRTTARAQSVSDATTSARKVLDLFDKQARYSTAVNSPGFGASGAYYVEYLAPAQDAEAKPFCAQWRYDPTGHTMSNRIWTEPATPPSAWSLMATNVRNAATNPPFVFTFAKDLPGLQRQQLTVTLDIGSATQAGAQVSTTYLARNTSVNTQSNVDANVDHVSDSPVCLSGVGRP
jgi:type II secretory pathway pseudopilin PulG